MLPHPHFAWRSVHLFGVREDRPGSQAVIYNLLILEVHVSKDRGPHHQAAENKNNYAAQNAVPPAAAATGGVDIVAELDFDCHEKRTVPSS